MTTVLIIIATFFVMEFVAWFTHKYIMHGFLWSWHEDHHVKPPGFFEKNDLFFLVFAIPSFLSFLFGALFSLSFLIAIGSGIAIYGFAYFIVHEVFIHQRIKWLRKTNIKYFEALRYAHKMHHKHLTKEGGESFGMLIIHPRYLQAVLKKKVGILNRS